jgi:hypothetical protein
LDEKATADVRAAALPHQNRQRMDSGLRTVRK